MASRSLAQKVMKAYSIAVGEKHPNYTAMIEDFIFSQYFPNLEVPDPLSYEDALLILQRVDIEWMKEYLKSIEFWQGRVPNRDYKFQ